MSSAKPKSAGGAVGKVAKSARDGVGKVPSKTPAKKHKAAPPGDVIPNPINYLDVLGSLDEVGNTPRPSNARTLFSTGMRSLAINTDSAEEQLNAAVTEARNAMKGQKKAPKVDVERLAYTYMGLGYCHVWSGKLTQAVTCYNKSLNLWFRLHTTNQALLIPLFCDLIILAILTNDSKQTQWINKCIKLFLDAVKLEADKGKTQSVGNKEKTQQVDIKATQSRNANAYSITRLANVACGLKGQAMQLPLKENAQKIVLPDKLVFLLYTKSIGYLNRKLSDIEKDESFLISLILFSEFLQNTKKSTTTKTISTATSIAPGTSEKDSNTITATATSTSTSTALATSEKVSDSSKVKSEKALYSRQMHIITEQIENLQVRLGLNPTTANSSDGTTT